MQVLSRIFSSSERSVERRHFIERSYASSGAVIAEVSRWSGHNARERPCLMEFHREWQHEKCPVMEWYNLQKSSSTRFSSIKHCSDMESPFFHEFLLLQLDDGAVCRVERTGEGSRVDAIRSIGCTANDYIQYYSNTGYKTYVSKKPFHLIAEIHLPTSLDIMDVLAVCYALFVRPRTRTYTLQRFNCYFFCNTVLLILSRRFLRWESTLTLESWNNAVSKSIDRLTVVSQHSPNHHLVFRVCHLLEPGSAEPARFILQTIRDALSGESDAYNGLKIALAGNLWRYSWPMCKSQAIARHIDAAVKKAICGDSPCARALNSAAHDSKAIMKRKHDSFMAVNKIFNKKALSAASDSVHTLTKISKEQYRLERIENPSSIFRDTWVWVASHAVGAWFPIQMLLAGDMEEWGFKGNLRGMYTVQRVGRLQSRRFFGVTPPKGPAIHVGNVMVIETTATCEPEFAEANYAMASQSLGETLQALSDKGMLTYSNITVALQATLCKNVWDDWLNKSFRDLLGMHMPDILEEEEFSNIRIRVYVQGGRSINISSVVQYQEYMTRRIEVHAKRVESYQLASAHLVSKDIRDAITSVWKLLPVGFANSVYTSTERAF